MGESESKPRLIHTRRGAVITLCVTLYLSALGFRDVLSHSQRKHHWLLDLNPLVYEYFLHFTLPAWVVAGVNLGFYAYLFWGGVVLYRIAQGKERVLVVGGFTVISLGLVQVLVSAYAAAAMDHVKALAELVALFAAVDILLRMPASGYPRVDNQSSPST
jgi:hypothetical protein